MSMSKFSPQTLSDTIVGTASDISSHANESIDATVAGAKSVLGNVGLLAKDAVSSADRTTRNAAAASANSLQDLMRNAGDLGTEASAAIRKNPLLVVGGALLLGYLFAKMRR